MTLAKAKELGLTVIEKEIHDPGVADELVSLGGKKQMPYMIDSDRGVSMYESSAIMAYLEENYAKVS